MIGRLVICALFIAGAYVCAAANTTSAQKCPTVEITAKEASVNAGGTVTLNVKVANPEANVDYTYNWSVSSGGISSGQGTSQVTVDLESDSMTATVDLGGGSPTCSNVASITITPKGKSGSGSMSALSPTSRQYSGRATLRDMPASHLAIVNGGYRDDPWLERWFLPTRRIGLDAGFIRK